MIGVGCVGLAGASAVGQVITQESLLQEMVDRSASCRFPDPPYDSLQASSYNRESVKRDTPGWFADSDGTGFIREELHDGRQEWVIMEHDGPGCITRIWTPFFYYDLSEHVGPNVRVYMDGAAVPVIDESLIGLVTRKGSVQPPFAQTTARAGDLYLPLPFARSCKVTTTGKPFYYIINYRGYPSGTRIESFRRDTLIEGGRGPIDRAATILTENRLDAGEVLPEVALPPTVLQRGTQCTLALPEGPSAVRELIIKVPGASKDAFLLRTTILVATFDGEQSIWCPLGDFFCSGDSLHPFTTWQRTVEQDGTFTCRWVMPYRSSASITLVNLGGHAVNAALSARTSGWDWDDRSMHFGAAWREDDIVPGTPFVDWNFIDLQGRGVYVGDAWTILNPQRNTWWGEGDEKIYVDGAWERGFPTHFGTGTEDYYGWAGGEIPTRRDEFSHPFLANVRVGGADGTTQGYNIVTRTRSLDAIPFAERLRFDMEASFGVDIREAKHHLGYSAVMFWYARPGVTHNRPPRSREAARGIMRLSTEGDRPEVVK